VSKDSKIEWTGDTHQFVSGCGDASPGCANCYAKRQAYRMASNPNAKIQQRYRGLTVLRGNGPQWTGEVRLLPEQLAVPLHQRAPRTIFVNSLSDTFHEDIPDEYIAAMFGVMAASPQHTYQVLTKRADRMRNWFEWVTTEPAHPGTGGGFVHPFTLLCGGLQAHGVPGVTVESLYAQRGGGPAPWPLPNVHLGVSVENRKHGVPRIEHLRKTPAAVRFLSVEPLLEDLGVLDLTGIHWVIVGGESGPRARPCHVAWIRRVVDQCRAQGVPVFVKQLGAYVVDRNDAGFLGGPDDAWDVHPEAVEHDLDGTRDDYQGAPVRVHLASKKGGDMGDWPADLRVREMPQGGVL